jgi:hypothetical protein
MELANNIILVGLGHKARQGKDATALILDELHAHTHVIHWADSLYNELRDVPEGENLIELEDGVFKFRDPDGSHNTYAAGKFPTLLALFRERGIASYSHMTDKDPQMLQFWGTEFRRNHTDTDYWVNKTLENLSTYAERNFIEDALYIVPIADTRFSNEARAVWKNGGIYVDIIRIREDGLRYIADDRDPGHPSEVDLDGVVPDYLIRCSNLDELREETKKLLEFIKTKAA